MPLRRLQLAGLVLLAVIAAGLSIAALHGVLSPRQPDAAPVARPSPTTPSASVEPIPTAATPGASASVSATATGLAGLAARLESGEPISILVLGDGSGDEDDEWVRTWADGLDAANYRSWNRVTEKWRAADPADGPDAPTVWNASLRSPDLDGEPARVAKVWRPADVVVLSYGHRKAAAGLDGSLTRIREAVLEQNPDADVLVMIQNPERPDTAAAQQETTRAVKAWAEAKDLDTVDVYRAFRASSVSRTALVEPDGSPTPLGSELWARTFAQALDEAS